MVKRFAIFSIMLGGIVLSSDLAQAACDMNQAAAKMAKLSEALGRRAAEAKTAEDSQKIIAANQKVTEAASFYQKQDYAGACDAYDKIAKENNIKL